MTPTPSASNDPPTHGLNLLPFALMAGGWLAPLLMFWLYVWGPLRPFAYPAGDLLPHWRFGVLAAACISLWWLLPAGYFRIRRFERSGTFYERLGVLHFRKLAPDGDWANRWERHRDPQYRIVRGRRSAQAFLARTEASERGHVVLLLLGAASAAWALAIGWPGWALYLSLGNVAVNVYPILLQRFNRARIEALLRRSRHRQPQAPYTP